MEDIIQRNEIKSVCPMTLSKPSGPHECCREQCAWWVSNAIGDNYVYAHCAIKDIAVNLEDISSNIIP